MAFKKFKRYEYSQANNLILSNTKCHISTHCIIFVLEFRREIVNIKILEIKCQQKMY